MCVLVKWSVAAHSSTVQDACSTDSEHTGRKARPRLSEDRAMGSPGRDCERHLAVDQLSGHMQQQGQQWFVCESGLSSD